MNSAKFKSTLSWKLNLTLEYCWLPVQGRRGNFAGFRICIICQTMVISLQQHYHCVILPLSSNLRHYLLELNIGYRNEFKKKGKSRLFRPFQIMQIGTPVKFLPRPGTGGEQYSNRDSTFQLSVDLNFALSIRRRGHCNGCWYQICNFKWTY